MIGLVQALLGMDRRTRHRLDVHHLDTDLFGQFRKTTGNQATKNPA
jgi:hypothetical protein